MTDAKPTLSVGLPVRNGRTPRVDASNPSWPRIFRDLELVIADNDSSDGTPELLHRYALEDERVRVHLNESNVGIHGNVNRVLDLSSGRSSAGSARTTGSSRPAYPRASAPCKRATTQSASRPISRSTRLTGRPSPSSTAVSSLRHRTQLEGLSARCGSSTPATRSTTRSTVCTAATCFCAAGGSTGPSRPTGSSPRSWPSGAQSCISTSDSHTELATIGQPVTVRH